MREGSTQENKTPRFAYTPYQQSERLDEMTIYVRVASSVVATIPDRIRETVRSVDAGVPVHQLQTLAHTVEDVLFNERMLAVLSAAFGLLATVLASVGLYGVMSYVVSRRTREIGIRIALGAERGTVIGMVLKEVTLLTLLGIALGVPAALSLSRFVRSQLYGISPADPLTMSVAAATLALVALSAGYIPARRASRVEPVLALRCE
jgi:ABC-type antimicrobial peptide transport system permease subunit